MTTNKNSRFDASTADLCRVWRAAFDASPELQSEFGAIAVYLAFKKNEKPFRTLARRYEADCAIADGLDHLHAAENVGRARVLNN